MQLQKNTIKTLKLKTYNCNYQNILSGAAPAVGTLLISRSDSTITSSVYLILFNFNKSKINNYYREVENQITAINIKH